MSAEIIEGMAVCIKEPNKNSRLLGYFENYIYNYTIVKQEIKIKGHPTKVLIQCRLFPNSQFEYYDVCDEMTFNEFFKITQPA